MNTLVLHLSHINNSAISFGGNCQVDFGKTESLVTDILFQSLEINRQLIAGISSAWVSEEEMYLEVNGLIERQRNLELQVSRLLSGNLEP